LLIFFTASVFGSRCGSSSSLPSSWHLQQFHLLKTRDLQGIRSVYSGKFARLLAYFRSPDWQIRHGPFDVPKTIPLQQGDMLALVDATARSYNWGINRAQLVSILFRRPAGSRISTFYEQSIAVTDTNGKTSNSDLSFHRVAVSGRHAGRR